MLNVLNVFNWYLLFLLKTEPVVVEPELNTLIEKSYEPVKKILKDTINLGRWKISSYYTPRIEARHNRSEKFCISFRITNKNKEIQLWIPKKNTGLTVEGFAKVVTESVDYIVDHHWEIQKYVKNALNKPLRVGQIACNKLPLRSLVLIDGKQYVVTDRGSGLQDKQIDKFTEDYKKITEFRNVQLIK